MVGDVQLKAAKIIHTCSEAVENHGGRCAQVELLIVTGVLGQGSSLNQLLDILRDFDFVHWLFKLGEEMSLILSMFAGLWVLLVPAFKPRGGVFLRRMAISRIQKRLLKPTCSRLVWVL